MHSARSPALPSLLRLALPALVALACGSAASPQTASLDVAPNPAAAAAGETVQFAATVAAGGGVDWSVREAGGGTISAAGLYQAPQASGTFHVVAVAQADPTVTGSATVVVTAPPATHAIAGTLSPASLGAGAAVALSGAATASTTAAADGSFRFDGLADGHYVVTPSAAGVAFTPASAGVDLAGADQPVAFTAASTGGTVLFYDDFTTGALGSQWVAMNRVGDVGNNEQECYQPGQVAVTGGNLALTTAARSTSCGDAYHAAATYPAVSGMVQWKDLHFTYGTVEVRAKVAGGTGTWPAIWFLGSNCQATNVQSADNAGSCSWPDPGSNEIDFVEFLWGSRTSVHQVVHTTNHTNVGCDAALSAADQNWHLYKLVWSAGHLEWFVDGVSTCVLDQAWVPSTPMFLIVNTAVGGAGGGLDASTLPQTTLVDYVRVTQP